MPRRKQPTEGKSPNPEKKRKPRTRGNGEGSIFYREDRDEWVAQITLENGKPRQKYRKTRSAAAKVLQEMLHEQQQGTLITSKSQTVGQCVEHWLENVHKRSIGISTYTEYRRILNREIIPALGRITLEKLTIQQVEAFYMRKQDEGIAPSTVRRIHTVLSQALDHAVRSRLIVYNVCDHVKPPRLTRHEIQPFTPEQAQQFLESVKGHRLEVLFMTAIVTGMRESELLALRWSDVSFESQYLQVRRGVRRVWKLGFMENDPKTASGRRRIGLPSFLLEMLKYHHTKQLEARLLAGAKWEEHNLVVTAQVRSGYAKEGRRG